jgi:hypothetical protein
MSVVWYFKINDSNTSKKGSVTIDTKWRQQTTTSKAAVFMVAKPEP